MRQFLFGIVTGVGLFLVYENVEFGDRAALAEEKFMEKCVQVGDSKANIRCDSADTICYYWRESVSCVAKK